MKFIADFHVHSKYSRATSGDMDIEHIDQWAQKKGITLMGTGDFTHHFWLSDLKKKLKPENFGLYKYGKTYFMLTAEVSNFWPVGGRVKKVHNLIFAPSFEVVDRINKELSKFGNLIADGRPILHLSGSDLVDLVLHISPDSLIIPAHAWTPHFSVFGSNSGFDSLTEAFGANSKYIYVIETGLSSDPSMNWKLSSLDKVTLISNSDAHSPAKIGREANVFDTEVDYRTITDAIKKKDKKRFLYTIEFFPEEGKYHFDGHRMCSIRWSPEETSKHNGICPVCKRPVTVGVMNRVKELSDRDGSIVPGNAIPFKNLVPLEEIISEAIGREVGTVSVREHYERLIKTFGNEFAVLLDVSERDLIPATLPGIVEGIMKVRSGNIEIVPGYDGEYGEINIFPKVSVKESQLGLF